MGYKALPLQFILASYNIRRRGVNMNRAHYDCMKILLARPNWGYVLLEQNYDVMIKSVYETVAILSALNGANDVHVRPCEPERCTWRNEKWDARALKLFRNESAMSAEQLNTTLTVVRGAVQASLTRAAVEWLVNTLDLNKTLEQLGEKRKLIDEVLIPMLQVSESLGMPGGFTSQCVEKGSAAVFITRIAKWQHIPESGKSCHSKKFRHRVCIFGVEDLHWLAKHQNLMANKMMSSFDYGAIDCMHELIFNRTHLGQTNPSLNLTVYKSLPHVLHHKNRLHPNPSYRLNCN
ncbi:hypothetical protein Q1695_005302 [Nippostrongylus brasiliensis]|nr:hypothetical protein Q1695_005302 [Nippostrongylus brasiliensis]